MSKKRIILIVIVVILLPLFIGLGIPRNRMVTEMEIIDKMYFFILADIANHYEETSWRTDIDTIIPYESIDGQEAWMEYYKDGDSVLWMVQRLSEKDYIRIIIDPSGKELMRNITIADVHGKTAIRYLEETFEPNPFKRFATIFKNKKRDRIKQYILDLQEKHKPDPNAPEEDDMGW